MLQSSIRSFSIKNEENSKNVENVDHIKEMKRLYKLYIPEKKTLALSMGALAISTGITMCIPAGMGTVIDLVTSPDGANNLPLVTGALASLFAVGAIANIIRIQTSELIGERITLRLRQSCYESIINQDIAFFDKTRTGEIVNRLSADTALVGDILGDNLSHGLRSTGQGIASLTMTFYTCPTLATMMLFIVPPVAVGAVTYGRNIRKLSKNVQKEFSKATELAEERLSNIRTVRWFTGEEREKQHHQVVLNDILKLVTERAKLNSYFFGAVDFSVKLSLLGILGYGGHMVLDGALTVGELTSFLLYTIYVGFSFGGLSSAYSDFMKGLGASARLFELIERKPCINVSSNTKKLPVSIDGKIEFNNVSFTYPTRPEIPVLEEFSLSIHPNETIALVGASGCGKSTIAALLGRIYEHDRGDSNGKIYVDDIDIMDVNPTDLRSVIGIVNQEPPLFAASIAENISYGNPSANLEQIQNAARDANAHAFISDLPKGYDTYVGERGQTLSGGQKQRVAIARALLSDPKILVMDEATSALDAESEKLVQDAIDRATENRTVLLISHRLSTIRNADRIAVLADGKVAELGTYDELVKNSDSLFSQLHLVDTN